MDVLKVFPYETTKSCFILFFSFLCIFIIGCIGTGISYKYIYLEEVRHYHTTQCHFGWCITSPATCYKDDDEMSFYPCYSSNLSYVLLLDMVPYTKQVQASTTSGNKWWDASICGRSSLVCFYDDRDVVVSLSLDEIKYIPGENRMILISLVPLISCIVTLIWLVCYWCRQCPPSSL
jgi:hypothetical protein